MAGEIKGAYSTGNTLYFHIVNASGQRWNGSAFETYAAANWASYGIALVEQGSSGGFIGTFPSTIADGVYEYFVYVRANDSYTESDQIVNTGKLAWNGTAATPALTGAGSTRTKITAAYQNGNTLYFHIINSAGKRWDGTEFETYASGGYSNYSISMTEQGSSGLFIGTVPSALTTPGTYEYFVYVVMGGSGVEGDPIVNTGKFIWDGAGILTEVVGSGMGGAAFRDYVVQEFKRTDKDTILYQAMTDTIREMRRKYDIAEDEAQVTVLDTLSAVGDYQLDANSGLGRITSRVTVIDSDSSTNAFSLMPLSKDQYDAEYPNQDATSVNTGMPVHYCLFGGKIWLGPVPDKITYTFKYSLTQDAQEDIVSTTASVPYTSLYREILKEGVLFRAWKVLQMYELASLHKNIYQEGCAEIVAREELNRGVVRTTRYQGI